MGRYRYKGTGNTGSFTWLMQRISGIVIAIMGSILLYQIAISEGTKKHQVYPWMLMPLMSFGLWHAFSGFKMITDDFVSNRIIRLALLIFYWGLGVVTFCCGLYLVIIYNQDWE